MPLARRARRTELNIWPAFVDALGQLVIAIIFLLLIFTVAQFLTTDALSGRDQALQRLTQQVNELTDLLNLEKTSNNDLRLNVAQLSAELQSANAAKDTLTTRLAELAAKSQDDAARADRASRDLADAMQSVSADKEKVQLQLAELESLRRDIEALKKVRSDLEAQVADLAGAQKKSQEDLTAARDRSKELETKLSTEQERTALAQKEIDKRDIRLNELAAQGQQSAEALDAEKKLTKESQDQVGLLNQQIAALRDQLAEDLCGARSLGGQEQGAAGPDRRSRPPPQPRPRQQGRGACPLPLGILRPAAPGAGRPAGHPRRRRPLRLPVRGAVRPGQRRPRRRRQASAPTRSPQR